MMDIVDRQSWVQMTMATGECDGNIIINGVVSMDLMEIAVIEVEIVSPSKVRHNDGLARRAELEQSKTRIIRAVFCLKCWEKGNNVIEL
jgi:hypothetical protein